MSHMPPFLVDGSPTLDTTQIRTEAYPLAGLIALFGGLALVPIGLAFMIGGGSPFGFLFTLLAQFILAVGTGIVLMYIIARAIQLARDGTANAPN